MPAGRCVSKAASPIAPARAGGSALPFGAACLGIAFFSAMDAVMKALTLAIGVYDALLWRTLLGLLFSGTLYFAARRPWPGRAAIRIHLRRGIVGAAMALFFFWGLSRLPMAEAIALAFVAPLVALYLAAAILGEPVGQQAILASAIGFAGVLVIVVARGIGGGEADLLGMAAVLFSALLYAYNIVLMRQQAQLAGPVEIAFSQNLVVATVLGLASPMFATVPEAGHWPALAFAACLAQGSLLLLAWAYARAEAQRLAPVEYTSLIWAALLGYLVFGEDVSLSTVFGALLIVAGCVIANRPRRGQVSVAEAAL